MFLPYKKLKSHFKPETEFFSFTFQEEGVLQDPLFTEFNETSQLNV